MLGVLVIVGVGVGVIVAPIDSVGVIEGVIVGTAVGGGVLVGVIVGVTVLVGVIVGVTVGVGVILAGILFVGVIVGVGEGNNNISSFEQPNAVFVTTTEDEGTPSGKTTTYPATNSFFVTPEAYKVSPLLPDK
jgi:hypothetical protein